MPASRTCIMVAGRAYGVYSSRAGLVSKLVEAGWRVIIASSFDPTAHRLAEIGAEWVQIPFYRGGISIRGEIAAINALRRLFRKEQPALVHVFGVKPMLLTGLASVGNRPARLVCNVTGLGYAFHTTRARRAMAEAGCRALLSKTDAVVFENRDDREWFTSKGIVRGERAHVILSAGVDVQRYHPDAGEVGPAGDRVQVLMASRLVWQKGVGEYLQAAAALRAEHQQARFLLAGSLEEDHSDGVPRAVIDRAVEAGDIEYIGYVADMPSLLRSTDIFVLPSYHEGGPRAVMEASASGVPVVAADVSGCRDMVRNDETGMLVPPRDVAGLRLALERLLTDPQGRRRMGRAGRALMVAEFQQAGVIDETLRLYGLLGLDTTGTGVVSSSATASKS